MPDKKTNKKSKTLLWQVTRKGDVYKHYILGTIHTATKEAMTFRALAVACIDKVTFYVGEMNLDTVDTYQLSKHLMLPDNLTLKDIFKEKKYLKYKKIIKKAYRIDLDDYIKYTPFYLLNFIAEQNLLQTASKNLDYDLWTYATVTGKNMQGLETFDDQCHIMQNIPLDYQIKAFKENLRNINLSRKNIIKLNDLYANGNLAQIFKTSKKSMGSIRKLMIYDRNDNMLKRCLDLFEQKSSFIAVGAAHLANNKGILAGLKRAGYKIKMIRTIEDI